MISAVMDVRWREAGSQETLYSPVGGGRSKKRRPAAKRISGWDEARVSREQRLGV
jgi:hypothetical protein